MDAWSIIMICVLTPFFYLLLCGFCCIVATMFLGPAAVGGVSAIGASLSAFIAGLSGLMLKIRRSGYGLYNLQDLMISFIQAIGNAGRGAVGACGQLNCCCCHPAANSAATAAVAASPVVGSPTASIPSSSSTSTITSDTTTVPSNSHVPMLAVLNVDLTAPLPMTESYHSEKELLEEEPNKTKNNDTSSFMNTVSTASSSDLDYDEENPPDRPVTP